jgi:hypothetical protein
MFAVCSLSKVKADMDWMKRGGFAPLNGLGLAELSSTGRCGRERCLRECSWA